MSFSDALAFGRVLDHVLIPYELAEGMEETRKQFQSLKKGESVGIFIGPEGGFEVEEVEKALAEAGAAPVTLGKRILRTETAGTFCTFCSLVSDGRIKPGVKIRQKSYGNRKDGKVRSDGSIFGQFGNNKSI